MLQKFIKTMSNSEQAENTKSTERQTKNKKQVFQRTGGKYRFT